MWSMLKAMFRALLSHDYTPGKAITSKQVIGSLLMPFPITVLIMAAVGAGSLFLPVSGAFRDALFPTFSTLLVAYVFLNPVIHGLVFRLRTKYDLRNVLLSVAIYFPMFTFAFAAYLHLMQVVLVGDTPFLAFSWFEVHVALWFSALVSLMLTLIPLAYRGGSAWPPAPAITAHRYYQLTEKAVSLGSLAGIAIVLLFLAW